MKSRKVIQILQTFSRLEMKQVGQLVHSPFFNTNKSVARLFDLIAPYYPDFEQSALERTSLFSRLFPSKTYNDQDFRLLVSELNKLVESFLIQQELLVRPEQQNEMLLKRLNSKGLDQLFKKGVNQSRKRLQDSPFRDAQYYRNALLVEESLYSYQVNRQSRKVDNNLEKVVDAIDLHFLSQRLKYSCEIINLQNILSFDSDLSFLDTLVSYLQAHPKPMEPAIGFYLQTLLTLRESENEDHYHKLKGLLLDHLDKFPTAELKDMFIFLQNYCIKQANQGNIGFLQELFDLFQLSLNHQIVSAGGTISQFDFKNIVAVSVRLGEYEWADRFIENYQNHVEEAFRSNAYHYNRARLLFASGHFRESLRMLLKVEYTEVFYELDSRSLLLKIYFELDDYEPFFSLVGAFRTFLRRDREVSDYQRKLYSNLITFSKKLMKVKMGSKKPVTEIKKEIDNILQIADRTWLNSKVAELSDRARAEG